MSVTNRFAVAIAAVFLAAPVARAQEVGIAVGKHAPAAVVETLDGAKVDLARYIGQSPVVLEFWATWCENCQALEPRILAAQKKYGARVRFVGVAVSVRQSPERLKLYAKKHGLVHEVLFDRTGAATDAYNVPATSYVVVIDRTGKVVYTGLGGDQNIDAAVRKAL